MRLPLLDDGKSSSAACKTPLQETIRQTKSVCPVCLERLNASVMVINGKVFMVKTCPKHGKFEILLSQNGKSYKNLEEFYFSVMSGKNKVLEYEIWTNHSCNMNCPICSLGNSIPGKNNPGPSCSEIEEFVKKSKQPFFTLSGGEPTFRKDLNKIIAVLKKHKKTVAMNSNGLRFTEPGYLKDLKESGLDRVNFQFDGFRKETYLVLRGADLLDKKLKILDNLKSVNIPVVLNATIAKNLNEGSVSEIIDYAVRNEFVNGVTFFTICNIGNARKWRLDDYIVPDEVTGLIEQQTGGRISGGNFYLFQKLHLALKSFLSQKACLYNRVYVLVRKNGTYKPIDEFINLKKLEPVLDIYRRLSMGNKFIAKLFFLLFFPITALINMSPEILREFIITAASYFSKTRRYLSSGRFLYLSISTGCDPFKMDYSVIKNCQNEIICADEKSGELRYQGSICLYGMRLEQPIYE